MDDKSNKTILKEIIIMANENQEYEMNQYNDQATEPAYEEEHKVPVFKYMALGALALSAVEAVGTGAKWLWDKHKQKKAALWIAPEYRKPSESDNETESEKKEENVEPEKKAPEKKVKNGK